MLQHLADRDCFAERDDWIKCGMALKPSYGDEVGFELWSVTHVDDRARNDAPTQWQSFAADAEAGHVTVGTLIKAAKDAGFSFGPPMHSLSTNSPTIEREEFTGSGGDVRTGAIFADMFRDKLLHVHEIGEWLQFNPQQGWMSAPPGEADRAAKEVLEAMRCHAAERWKAAPDDPKTKRLLAHVERTSNAPHLRAMIEMAKSVPGMTVQLTEFDSDPMLLGVANGVLTLNKGTLLTVAPEILVSKRCAVAFDPAADCPRFERFMIEVQPNPDIRLFLQRLV